MRNVRVINILKSEGNPNQITNLKSTNFDFIFEKLPNKAVIPIKNNE